MLYSVHDERCLRISSGIRNHSWINIVHTLYRPWTCKSRNPQSHVRGEHCSTSPAIGQGCPIPRLYSKDNPSCSIGCNAEIQDKRRPCTNQDHEVSNLLALMHNRGTYDSIPTTRIFPEGWQFAMVREKVPCRLKDRIPYRGNCNKTIFEIPCRQ